MVTVGINALMDSIVGSASPSSTVAEVGSTVDSNAADSISYFIRNPGRFSILSDLNSIFVLPSDLTP